MSRTERAFSVIFGVFLLVLGIYVLLYSEAPAAWRLGGGLALAVFGANMLYAAYYCKSSWLSRIGPLP